MATTEWKLVPVEPTRAMMDAVDSAYDIYSASKEGVWCGAASVYRAMLSATPTPAQAYEKALRRAVTRAMEGAGTLPAKDSVKLCPSDWHLICDLVLRPAPTATLRPEGGAVAWPKEDLGDGRWVDVHPETLARATPPAPAQVEAASLPAPGGVHEALRAIYEWYDRDGSVGGASEVFEKHRAALATDASPSGESRPNWLAASVRAVLERDERPVLLSDSQWQEFKANARDWLATPPTKERRHDD